MGVSITRGGLSRETWILRRVRRELRQARLLDAFEDICARPLNDRMDQAALVACFLADQGNGPVTVSIVLSGYDARTDKGYPYIELDSGARILSLKARKTACQMVSPTTAPENYHDLDPFLTRLTRDYQDITLSAHERALLLPEVRTLEQILAIRIQAEAAERKRKRPHLVHRDDLG